MEYTKEELIIECKKRYSLGMEVKFCSPNGGFTSSYKLKSVYPHQDFLTVNCHGPNYSNSINLGLTDGNSNWLYIDGKWATIISTPESKIHFNYLIL